MARERHLAKAPITEALIDIRVKLPLDKQDPTYIKVFNQEMQKLFPGQFPQEKELRDVQMMFEIGPPPRQETKSSHVGYRYDSEDGKRVIQTKLDSFTFSWLKPYENWEVLRRNAYTMWQVYRDLMKPEAITRIATRFINQIEIPGPLIDFDDYLTAAPVIPKALPQAYSSFLTRMAIPDEKNQVMIIITQAFQQGVNPKMISVVIDIDVFMEKLFENQTESWDTMAWDTIDSLRAIKNRVFFESITETTAGLLE
ncbi:MAG: TIGR04255 family protein [Nitrospira sp.]|nr:MAG: TIGR04255 family protein [Nitrospira sp.]